jgi:eukaryotic-like serine/threonine-protein kinase
MSAVHGTSGISTPAIPGYEVLQVLGGGGMGIAYLARQETLKRLVCVKVMSISDQEGAELSRARFNREAELLASVSHPNILSVFDFGVTADSGLPFLVTEYIEKGDLRKILTAGEPLPVGQARSILGQVGEAIEHLHGRGIIHRDLKPENILMCTGSHAKVGDFGIAVMQESVGSLTRSLRGLGTLGYVSPEQQYGLEVDERADQYSLAALSYELLTGRRPLGRFPPPSQVNPRLRREVDLVLLRALREEPEERYRSVQEYMRALDKTLSCSRHIGRHATLVCTGLLLIGSLIVAAAALLGVWPRTRMPIRERPALSAVGEPVHQRPIAPKEPDARLSPRPDAPARSRELTRLLELRAYRIWERSGRPKGQAGEAVKMRNWLEAERQVGDEISAKAYRIWERQGCPVGAAGEAVRETNRHTAEVELLKEIEYDSRHPGR